MNTTGWIVTIVVVLAIGNYLMVQQQKAVVAKGLTTAPGFNVSLGVTLPSTNPGIIAGGGGQATT